MDGWLEKAELKPTQFSWSLAELGNIFVKDVLRSDSISRIVQLVSFTHSVSLGVTELILASFIMSYFDKWPTIGKVCMDTSMKV